MPLAVKSIRVDEDLWRELERRAQRLGMTTSSACVQAIERFLGATPIKGKLSVASRRSDEERFPAESAREALDRAADAGPVPTHRQVRKALKLKPRGLGITTGLNLPVGPVAEKAGLRLKQEKKGRKR